MSGILIPLCEIPNEASALYPTVSEYGPKKLQKIYFVIFQILNENELPL